MAWSRKFFSASKLKETVFIYIFEKIYLYRKLSLSSKRLNGLKYYIKHIVM